MMQLSCLNVRKLPTTTTIMAAEAKAMNSGTSGSSLPGDGEKSFLTFGRAEMKKQAKKGSLKRQKKRCKRKAEGEIMTPN